MRYLPILLLLLLGMVTFTACRKQEYYKDVQTQETTIPVTTAPPATLPVPPSIEPVTEPPTEEATIPEPADTDFVRILDYIPTAYQELVYATDQNFTGQVIYPFYESYLRYGTVKKLMQVSEALEQQGLYLKIWDGFRPTSAQFKLWEILPDDTYVADPRKGFSKHSRGNTVDLTLVDAEGMELEMPTEFDDFSSKANRDYSDCTEIQKENAMLLQTTMEKYGFTGYYGEWWHFSDVENYPVEENFQPPVG